MTNKNRGQWTTKDVERLREEWAKGTSTKNIATLLGRTQGSVYTRLSMLRKSGVDIERRGESTGPVKPSRKGGPKNVLPTGEDAEPKSKKPAEKKVELTQFMVDKTSEEFAELRERQKQLLTGIKELRGVIKMMNRKEDKLRSDNASLRQRLSQVKQKSSDAATEFMRQLKRENAALRAALVASNDVIAVYMAQEEVEE